MTKSMGTKNMGTKVYKVLDILPRWLLVALATYGLFLLQQKFDLMDKTIRDHDRSIVELQIIGTRLATIIEIRREKQ